jgi:type I restriction enzyme S subunit
MTRKNTQQALVPRLRFPEFYEDAPWQTKRLNHLFDERTEKGGEKLPLLSLTDMEGLIRQEDSGRKDNSNADKSRYARVYPGDIAYNTMRMWEGRSALATEEGLVSPAYTVCRPRDNQDGSFYAYYFKTAQAIEQFRRFSQGLVKDTLSLKFGRFAKIQLPTTSLAEQQKIADCLSSLDDLIAAEGRKLEALRDHKKGLMQQLFPREGETQPRLRFPEFRSALDWKGKALGTHVKIRSGGSPSQFVLSARGTYPFVKVEDLNNCTKYQITAREFCDDGKGGVPRNSLLFPKRGAAIELNKIRITGTEILIDTNLMAITPTDELDAEFLFYYISSIGLAHIADTSTIPQINNKHIIPFKILFPSMEEQHRIADCLSALDARIAAQAEKLDALRTHKRGLMQQLFPKPAEVGA